MGERRRTSGNIEGGISTRNKRKRNEEQKKVIATKGSKDEKQRSKARRNVEKLVWSSFPAANNSFLPSLSLHYHYHCLIHLLVATSN